jgi:hypothetical protein
LLGSSAPLLSLLSHYYPSGRIVHYQLDALSRVIEVTTQQTSASPVQSVDADFEYLPFGLAQGWKSNGVRVKGQSKSLG